MILRSGKERTQTKSLQSWPGTEPLSLELNRTELRIKGEERREERKGPARDDTLTRSGDRLPARWSPYARVPFLPKLTPGTSPQPSWWFARTLSSSHHISVINQGLAAKASSFPTRPISTASAARGGNALDEGDGISVSLPISSRLAIGKGCGQSVPMEKNVTALLIS